MSTRLEALTDQLRSPIVQAPMAGGPSTPALAAAVHRAGGFGQLAGGNLTAETLAGHLDDVDDLLEGDRTESGLLPVGVNLFVPDPDAADPGALEGYRLALRPAAEALGVEVPQVPAWSDDDYPAKLDLLLSHPPAAVSFTFGLPEAPAVRALQEAGVTVVLSVAGVPGARRAAALGPDALVVQGQQAGGHRAVLSMHDEPEPIDTLELLGAVRAALGGHPGSGGDDGVGTVPPLIAAGGVGTAQDVADLLAAGARLVQVGTQFLTAREAGTRAAHRQAVLDPGRSETVVTRAFSGRPARGLRNLFIDELDDQAVVGYPQVNRMTAPLRAAASAAGDPEHLSLWAGTRTAECRDESAAEILARLAP
ncbi:NAD(P)H-dependent flavin oxidoreductase [Nesterenkonia xinjiangensis]|uniref:Propionate 3-nitronate monooxygenase n=1 Tax=Nesterenkonia xinjiangensis TaxID=225327 RepID=A0A7Z0GMC4_9MICC|nr:nitronate monooxygenase [Nesterenkonia xinjiangensis]NYJ78550.1 nitronate monooxygenase [Nesterenkonia xinjiangensis]